jgi:Flp pilus assembly protein TadG
MPAYRSPKAAGRRRGRGLLRPGCRGARRKGGDGGYTVVEAAVGFPIVFFAVMLMVQFALLWHGRHVAESAAREGLDAASGFHAPAGAGQEAAQGFLRDVAPHLLIAPQVTVTRTATTIQVQVRAQVVRLIPGAQFVVSESVQGPIERFVADPAPGLVGA